MEYIVRNAKKQEARDIAFLINFSGKSDRCEGLNFYAWGQEEQGADPYDVGAREISQDIGQYSYKNIRVVDVDGRVVAVALSYQLKKYGKKELEKIPEIFHIFRGLTNPVAGAYYLDSLASLPDYRGYGFGRKMLEDTISIARDKGYDSLYLIAYEENIPAVSLYKKAGFYPADSVPAPDHPEMPYSGHIVLFKKDL